MITDKNQQIVIDLPHDIIFAMRGIENIEEIKKKLKIALSIYLFQEKTISLGKAIELSELNRIRFIEMLSRYGITSYEYDEKEFERDQQAICCAMKQNEKY
jgi:predicted HTH domain antitoxin